MEEPEKEAVSKVVRRVCQFCARRERAGRCRCAPSANSPGRLRNAVARELLISVPPRSTYQSNSHADGSDANSTALFFPPVIRRCSLWSFFNSLRKTLSRSAWRLSFWSSAYFAWKLSCRLPLRYHVHLIQTYRLETQQVVEVTNVDPERVQTEELVNLITEERTFGDQPTTSEPPQRYSPRVRAFVVHSPSFIRPIELRSESFEPGTTTIHLPLNLERHIAQVYQTLQLNSDLAVASAVIISLFRAVARRLSSQNSLYISRLLTEVGTTNTYEANNLAFSPPNEEDESNSSPTSTSASSRATSSDSSAGRSENNPEVASPTAAASTEETTTPPANMSESDGPTVPVAPAEETNGFTIKLKFLDDTERIIKTTLSATVLDFKKTNFSDQVASGKVIRLIFKGQLLRDDNRSLESYGLYDQCIHPPVRPPSGRQNAAGGGVNAADDRHAYNSAQVPPRPVFDELNNESWLMRMLRLGVYYADMVPFVLFYALTACVNWIREVENVRNEQNSTWVERQINCARRGMLAVLSLFVDFSAQQQQHPDDLFANRFNLGVLFTLLFTVKFMSIWFVVIYFPQFADTKGVFLLLILTIFFGLYTFQNRPRRQEADGVNIQ
ncbi:Ubiquitin-like domain-containing protein [Aphelenchoides fujianensis]|nr:Ubiquitin-like domain-containing protein [Aphelenchoides fujianensis]